MLDAIQDCAKRVAEALSRAQELNILRLPEVLGERSVVAYQALGWLARHGSIRYMQRGNDVFVSLADGESRKTGRTGA